MVSFWDGFQIKSSDAAPMTAAQRQNGGRLVSAPAAAARSFSPADRGIAAGERRTVGKTSRWSPEIGLVSDDLDARPHGFSSPLDPAGNHARSHGPCTKWADHTGGNPSPRCRDFSNAMPTWLAAQPKVLRLKNSAPVPTGTPTAPRTNAANNTTAHQQALDSAAAHSSISGGANAQLRAAGVSSVGLERRR